MNNHPRSRQTNIVVQEMKNQLLIYDLNINKAYCLNETSVMIWQLCSGKNSIADISLLMGEKLKMQVSEELVWLALDRLKKDDLLEKAAEFEINFGGLNRRQIIKKVGLASMIALPIIASVVAPSALMAQSSCVPNQLCPIDFNGNTICCPTGTSCSAPGLCCPNGATVCDFTNDCCLSGICAGSICCPPATFACGELACCNPGETCDPFDGFCF